MSSPGRPRCQDRREPRCRAGDDDELAERTARAGAPDSSRTRAGVPPPRRPGPVESPRTEDSAEAQRIDREVRRSAADRREAGLSADPLPGPLADQLDNELIHRPDPCRTIAAYYRRRLYPGRALPLAPSRRGRHDDRAASTPVRPHSSYRPRLLDRATLDSRRHRAVHPERDLGRAPTMVAVLRPGPRSSRRARPDADTSPSCPWPARHNPARSSRLARSWTNCLD